MVFEPEANEAVYRVALPAVHTSPLPLAIENNCDFHFDVESACRGSASLIPRSRETAFWKTCSV
jgi:hypothetical protein